MQGTTQERLLRARLPFLSTHRPIALCARLMPLWNGVANVASPGLLSLHPSVPERLR